MSKHCEYCAHRPATHKCYCFCHESRVHEVVSLAVFTFIVMAIVILLAWYV